MAKKIGFLLGMGAGYVLGARAGRQRYEQIAEKAKTLWRDPRVQEKAGQAQDLAKEHAGKAGHAVKEKADHAGSAVTSKVGGKSSDKGGHGSADSSLVEGGLTDPAADENIARVAASGSSGSGTPKDTPTHGGAPIPSPPSDSPSAKLPPHPVAEPGKPGGSPS